jgi:hypothetical protein
MSDGEVRLVRDGAVLRGVVNNEAEGRYELTRR